MLKHHSIASAVLAFLVIVLSISAQNQSPQQRPQQAPGTASIAGTIMAMGTNAPIAGARVEARRGDCSSSGGENASTTSDVEGRFLLEKLHAGGWCIGAAYAGGQYTPAEYMQRGALGRGLTLPVTE